MYIHSLEKSNIILKETCSVTFLHLHLHFRHSTKTFPEHITITLSQLFICRLYHSLSLFYQLLFKTQLKGCLNYIKIIQTLNELMSHYLASPVWLASCYYSMQSLYLKLSTVLSIFTIDICHFYSPYFTLSLQQPI